MKKKEIRQLYKQKRANLSSSEREQFSAQIAAQYLNFTEDSAKHVSIFLPIERFNEIETKIIIKHSKSTFYLPVVRDHELKHIRLDSMDQIQVSAWGIPEPTYGEEVSPDLFNLVLVPLLAVDKKGNRVGYGKGFYDGFLRSCSPTCRFVGLSYFDPTEAIEDVHDGDIPLHYCITPNSTLTF